jgi:DNA topoisomerase-1
MNGLRQVDPSALTIRRRRCGRGFVYLRKNGKRLTNEAALTRIRSLAIPPAYRHVRIAAQPNAHLQAVGRDDAGRIQYRYHPQWETVREKQKVERLATLCGALPRIRRRIAYDLKSKGLARSRVLAGVVTLIDRTHIRIGCEDYVHSGRSRGAATLLKRNVCCEKESLHLTFNSKGGREIRCSIRSCAIVTLVKALARLPGRRLFQYRDEDGSVRRVTAADVNAYLQEISGASITAKDFRTLAATAAAAERLAAIEPADTASGRRKQISATVKEIAEMLGNTPAVARKSYVHHRVIEAFGKRTLVAASPRRRTGLSRGESAVAILFA